MRDFDHELIFLPRAGDARDAALRYGVSVRTMQRLAKDHPQITKRLYGSTVFDFAAIDAVFDALPLAADVPSRREVNLRNMEEKRLAAAKAARQAAKVVNRKVKPAAKAEASAS